MKKRRLTMADNVRHVISKMRNGHYSTCEMKDFLRIVKKYTEEECAPLVKELEEIVNQEKV